MQKKHKANQGLQKEKQTDKKSVRERIDDLQRAQIKRVQIPESHHLISDCH